MMVLIYQFSSKQIEKAGIKFGLMITTRMLELQGNQLVQIIGLFCFGIWTFLIASMAFLK